jgi:PRTRC genetic system protein C
MSKALTKTVLERAFEYAGVLLTDPDPTMTPTHVRDFLAATGRPELTSAEVRGPEQRGNQLVYTLHRVTGTKGREPDRKMSALPPRAISVRRAIDKLEARVKAQTEQVSLSLTAPLCALATNSGEHRNLLPTEVVPWVG